MPTATVHSLVLRVALRYEARLQAERTAREVQRRREGLVDVSGDDDQGDDGAQRSRTPACSA